LNSLLQVTAIVEEYFSSGDVSNAADSLSELGPVESMGHYFVKRLVTLALDRKDKEREMASSLLSNLYAEVRLQVALQQKWFAQGWVCGLHCSRWPAAC
jgi:hypothetical protein